MSTAPVITDATTIRQALATGEIHRVLAIRASRLGDLLMTTPALHAFTQAWPGCAIDFLTNTYSRAFLQGNSDIRDVHVFDGTERDLLGRKAKVIRGELAGRYSMILALRPRRDLARLAEILKVPYLFPGGDQDISDRSKHAIQHCFDRLRPLGLEGQPGPMRLNVTADDKARARTLVSDTGRPLVLLHPGCDETLRFKFRRGIRRRIWPITHWVELIGKLQDSLEAEVLLSSGSRIEGHWVEKIRSACDHPPRHFSRLPLGEFCGLTSHVDLVITVDTGPLHIACATGTPLLGLYGPSPRSFTGPWGEHTRVIQKDIECSPCQGKGIKCSRNICMEQILPDEVLETAHEMVLESAARA